MTQVYQLLIAPLHSKDTRTESLWATLHILTVATTVCGGHHGCGRQFLGGRPKWKLITGWGEGVAADLPAR